MATSTAASVQSIVLEKYPRLHDELQKYPKPDVASAVGEKDEVETPIMKFKYGTAGFRENAELLKSTFHRMGMLAVLRSRKEGKIAGVMVTASHNAVFDNGIKLVDPDGGMMSQSWESYAVELANAETEQVAGVLDKLIAAEKIDMDRTGNIFIAKDTRPSSEHLSELAREGALLVGGNVLDFSLQTTPQLHHLVRMWNHEAYNKGDWASETGYYNMLVDAFKQLTSSVDAKVLQSRTPLYVDGACGVGALQFTKLSKELGDVLRVEMRNSPGEGELNHQCGAEHVQKGRSHPVGFTRDADRDKRCCSFDGDADRLVYHYFDASGTWHLLDGDKIACLFSTFVQEQLQILGIESSFSLGIVQTAYANGASTMYLREKKLQVVMAKTGVKYCHAKAAGYDIGIYFEANGHGTIMFKDAAVERLQKMEGSLSDDKRKQAFNRIMAVHQLINQAVGDAMSDCLLIEALLILKGWKIADWDAIYADLPSRQTKLAVLDRSMIKCNEDETKVIQPEGLQKEVDAVVVKYEKGRGFLRPSGTENVVRIYAEGVDQEQADALALELAQLTHRLARGVGEAPTTLVA